MLQQKLLIRRNLSMVRNETMANVMRKAGFPHTADYILMFGVDNMNPWFINGANEETELFYKRCVEEKHPWDYYMDAPEESAVL